MSRKSRRHRSPAASLPDGTASLAGSKHWPALTGLRGVAALMVLLLHAYVLAGRPTDIAPAAAWLFASGWSGVDIFFTLSAFLLTLPFLRAQSGLGATPTWGDYWRRRLLRIAPAYYAQLALLFALAAAGAVLPLAWDPASIHSVLGNVFFLYGIDPSLQPAVPPWWTLPVELGFYLLLPLFARCLRPGRWAWLLVGIVLSLGWRVALMHAGLSRAEEVAWVEHLPGRLHQFLVGMLAAYAFFQWRRQGRLPRGARADVIATMAFTAFLLLPALGYLSSGVVFAGGPVRGLVLSSWHLYASLLVSVLLIAQAAGAPWTGRLFSALPLRAIGVVSYSLYLWHYPVLLAVREGLGGAAAVRGQFWPFLLYGLLFSLLVAGASWWLVERPALAWRRRVVPPTPGAVKLPA